MKKRYFSLIIVALIVIDQIIKIVLLNKLPDEFDSIAVIDGVLNFTHIKNYGAAFGILNGKQFILFPVIILLMVCFVYFVFSGKLKGRYTQISVAMIVAGGASNLIDRIFRGGYVFDYIDLTFSPFQNFAVFNFADCFVVVGTVILLICMIRDDFFTSRKAKEKEDSENNDLSEEHNA